MPRVCGMVLGIGGGGERGGVGWVGVGGGWVRFGGDKGRGGEGKERAHALDGGDEGRVGGDVDCFLGGCVGGGDWGVEEGAFG